MVFFHFVFCLKSRGHVTSFKTRSGYGIFSFLKNIDTTLDSGIDVEVGNNQMVLLWYLQTDKGTIHLRRQQILRFLTPTPSVGRFLLCITCWQILPIFDPSRP